MEIRTLNYFLTVARMQSFSKAAQELHITQPNLSRQIKELEDQYHVTLFKRDTRHVELTSEGRLLKKRAEEMIRLKRVIEEELTDPEIFSGDIHIACPESNSMALIVNTIKKISEKQPHIRFHLHSGNAELVECMIDEDEVEFGIVVGQNHLEKYDFMPLSSYEQWGVYLPADDPLALKDVITPMDLKGRPLILSNQDMISSKFHGWANSNKEPLNIIATYNLINNGLLLTKNHIGYCIGLDHMSCIRDDSLCFKQLSPPLIDQSMVIWKRYHYFSNIAQYFLSELKDVMYYTCTEDYHDRETEDDKSTAL